MGNRVTVITSTPSCSPELGPPKGYPDEVAVAVASRKGVSQLMLVS
jgi:hypothetical protein